MNTPMPATEESNTAAMAAAAPAQPMVRFASVTKRYGELTVLEGSTLMSGGREGCHHRPQRLGQVDPAAGADDPGRHRRRADRGGRRTLTHMPDGHGRLVPANARHLRRVRGKVGMVFQSFNLFPHMNALQNVMEAPVQVLG